MIKRLLTIYLPAAAVLTTATLAAVFLYNDSDPELDDVEFVIAENPPRLAELVEGEAGAEELSSEELRITNNELREDVKKSIESVETYRDTSQSEVIIEPNRDDIRIITIEQTEPVVVIISGSGVSVRCEVSITETKTAHQVMKQAADQCDFAYVTKQYASLGVFVDGIAGLTSNKSAGLYWIFSVNGTKANVGVSSYQIQPGDSIAWNYEAEY